MLECYKRTGTEDTALVWTSESYIFRPRNTLGSLKFPTIGREIVLQSNSLIENGNGQFRPQLSKTGCGQIQAMKDWLTHLHVFAHDQEECSPSIEMGLWECSPGQSPLFFWQIWGRVIGGGCLYEHVICAKLGGCFYNDYIFLSSPHHLI